MSLITLDNIRDHREVSAQLPAVRYTPYITEAEELDVRPLLNAGCKGDLMSSIQSAPASTDPNYALLLSGGAYTNSAGYSQYFKGLKAVIALYAYARIVINNKFNVTNYGLTIKETPHSQPIDSKDMARIEGAARSAAAAYWEGCRDYLNDQSENFPLWGGGEIARKAHRITAVK